MKLQAASFGFTGFVSSTPPPPDDFEERQAMHSRVLVALFGAAAVFAFVAAIGACGSRQAGSVQPPSGCIVQTCAGLVECVGELPEGVRCEEVTEAQARREGLIP